MKKTFILDTNVLIHDPESILKFEDNDIVIPISVIEELDKLKKGYGEVPYSARQALKLIDSLRTNGNSTENNSLSTGVVIPNGYGATLRVELDEDCTKLRNHCADNRIISVAVNTQKKKKEERVVIVSKDAAVRIKAESIGLIAQDYKNDKTSVFKQYGKLLNENSVNGIKSVRYIKDGENIYRIQGHEKTCIKRNKIIEGISPKNEEQECAIDALLNPKINVIALTGKAGSGKTLLSLAAALHQALKKDPLYEQVLVARPVVPMGNDIGYLPGDVSDKLKPYMQPIFDNLEVIVDTPKGITKDNRPASKYKNYQYLVETGILQIEPLTYIRGRSLPRRYFIVDEAQNLRPIDVKTIITRCGEGTKIVFTGDIDQIDNPFLDSMSNGLSYLVSKFINIESFCYINLSTSARSTLADVAAELL